MRASTHDMGYEWDSKPGVFYMAWSLPIFLRNKTVGGGYE